VCGAFSSGTTPNVLIFKTTVVLTFSIFHSIDLSMTDRYLERQQQLQIVDPSRHVVYSHMALMNIDNQQRTQLLSEQQRLLSFNIQAPKVPQAGQMQCHEEAHTAKQHIRRARSYDWHKRSACRRAL
jgi:uncharacterized ubiquitin-like protein YukD